LNEAKWLDVCGVNGRKRFWPQFRPSAPKDDHLAPWVWWKK